MTYVIPDRKIRCN